MSGLLLLLLLVVVVGLMPPLKLQQPPLAAWATATPAARTLFAAWAPGQQRQQEGHVGGAGFSQC
jgi:hypothetical protein